MKFLRDTASLDSGFFTGAPGRPAEGDDTEGRPTAGACDAREGAPTVGRGAPTAGLATGVPAAGVCEGVVVRPAGFPTGVPIGVPILGRAGTVDAGTA